MAHDPQGEAGGSHGWGPDPRWRAKQPRNAPQAHTPPGPLGTEPRGHNNMKPGAEEPCRQGDSQGMQLARRWFMGKLTGGTYWARWNVFCNVLLQSWPPELLSGQNQSAANSRVTGQLRCMGPMEDLQATRKGNKKLVRRAAIRALTVLECIDYLLPGLYWDQNCPGVFGHGSPPWLFIQFAKTSGIPEVYFLTC